METFLRPEGKTSILTHITGSGRCPGDAASRRDDCMSGSLGRLGASEMKQKERKVWDLVFPDFPERESEQENIHRAFEGKIPDFFADQLTNRELEDFLAHYDEYRECRDELSIQYLIHTGLARLETGEVFNLQKELAAYVALERGRLFRRERNVKLTALYELFTLLAFAGAVAACYVLGIV